MATQTDVRQTRQRTALDQLSPNTNLRLDTLLNLINDELTPSLRLSASSTPDLVLNIGAITITTQDGSEGTQRKHTIPPIGSQYVLPSFSSGTITFPSAPLGTVTLSPGGTTTLPSIPSGQYMKVLVGLKSDGNLGVAFGSPGATADAATMPIAISNAYNIGYVLLQNSGGVIQPIDNADIFQFIGGGGSGGSGASQYVSQTGHGFAVGDLIYVDATGAWAKAIATGPLTLAMGMVALVPDANSFIVQFSGQVSGLTGRLAGNYYYLSAATAGEATTSDPGSTSNPSQLVYRAISSTTVVLMPMGLDKSTGSAYFNEAAQDAVGAIVTDTNTIDIAYTDGVPSITADVRYQDTNTIDLADDASGLKATVKYQSSNDIRISDDTSGLKADLRTLPHNYVKNPDAELSSTANITVNPLSDSSTNVTVAGETTTELFGTQSFKLTSDSTGKWAVGWDLDALDLGLSNRLGEATIVLKGPASATLFFKVLDAGGNVLAQMTGADKLVLDSTNPKKFSLVFPVPALPNALKLVLGDSSVRIAAGQQITVDQVYLGEPVSTSSGNIVTEPVNFTPTGSWTTNTTYTGKWWRSGDRAYFDILVSLAGAPNSTELTVNLPFTIDTAKMTLGNTGDWFGDVMILDGGVGWSWGKLRFGTSTRVDVYYNNAFMPSGFAAVTQIAPITFANADNVRLLFSVPISGWAATDIVTPEASLVEYASTNGTWDANDTTVYRGSDGSVMGGALSLSRAKTISWLKAPVAGDSIYIEFSTDRVTWFDAAQNSPYTLSSSGTDNTSAGVYYNGSSVVFARYRNIANDDSPVTDWPNNLYWRVKKVPASGSQSFYIQGPVKTAETGTAIPAGYAGYEVIAYGTTTTTMAADTEIDVTSASITLTPGVWDLEYSVSGFLTRSPASTSDIAGRVRITDSGNSGVTGTESLLYLGNNASSVAFHGADMHKKIRVNLSVTRTYKLRITCNVASATGTMAALNGNAFGGITGSEATTYIRATLVN